MHSDPNSSSGVVVISISLGSINDSELSAQSRHCISPLLPHTNSTVPAGCHEIEEMED